MPDFHSVGFAPAAGRRAAAAALSAPPRGRFWSILPWLVLAIGIPASLYLFTVLSEKVENIARLRFEKEASDARRVIDVRIHAYAAVLYGVRAVFATNREVSRLEFRDFVRALDLKNRYPSLESVNYMMHVRDEDRERFEDWVRHDVSVVPQGYPHFAIKPPGRRPEYFPLVYLEPMEGFEFAFGRDLGANPATNVPETLAAAVRLTRDSGELTASGLPLRMKAANRQYTGLAMRLAVYRPGMPVDTVEGRQAAFVGSIGAGFNVDDLMTGVLDAEISRHMRFQLYDAGSAGEQRTAEPSQRRLLYSSVGPAGEESPPQFDDATWFTRELPLEVGGRVWMVHFSAPKKDVREPLEALSPWAALFSGVISSFLLCGVMFSLSSSQQRAIGIANEMTRSLRESEGSLAEAHAMLSDAQKLAGVGCCQHTPASERLVWSDELYRIHGVDPGTFTPRYDTAMALVHPEDRERWDRVLSDALASGEPFTAEFRIVRPDGAIRHVRSLGEVMNDSAGGPLEVLWSVLDITEQKQTEHVLRSSAEQLTALSRRLVDIQETERRQLSRELHDRIGQNLTALSINLDILASSLADARHAEQRARLSDSAALLESTVDSIENVMAELRPPMLDDYGLLPALHWYAKDFSNRTGVDVSVAGNESAERPAPEMEIALFRIAQEALTNVAKHAGATRVEIVLEHSDSRCAMTVTDNGVGVEPARREAARHGLGMVTMRERSQAVGGRFSVQPVPGGGTQVAITIP